MSVSQFNWISSNIIRVDHSSMELFQLISNEVKILKYLYYRPPRVLISFYLNDLLFKVIFYFCCGNFQYLKAIK